MKHRYLTAVMVSIMLAGGVGVISTAMVPTQTVQAVSKHSRHWHWVHTTREKTIMRINPRLPRYRWRPLEEAILPKGFSMKVRYFSNDNYYQLKNLGVGMGGTWIVRGSNTSWFRNGYKKPPMAK